MKLILNYVIAGLVACTMLVTSCGDTPLTHGVEFTVDAPDAKDDAELNTIIAILNTRLQKSGISESDFDVILDSSRVKVRVAEGVVENEQRFLNLIQSGALLTFRAMYDLAEIGGLMDSARKVHNRISGIDSMQVIADPGFWKYCTPAYDFTQPSYGYSMPIIFYCQAKDTGTMNTILKMDSIAILFPPDLVFMWGNGTVGQNGEQFLSLFACKKGRNYEVSGEHIASVELEENPNSGSGIPEVMINFDATGTDEWAKLTKANIGRSIAIEVDGFVYSSPTVQSEITGGSAQISGPEQEDMENIAALLSAGNMPVRLTVISRKNF